MIDHSFDWMKKCISMLMFWHIIIAIREDHYNVRYSNETLCRGYSGEKAAN